MYLSIECRAGSLADVGAALKNARFILDTGYVPGASKTSALAASLGAHLIHFLGGFGMEGP